MKKIKSILLTSLIAVTAFSSVACSNKSSVKTNVNFVINGGIDEETNQKLNANLDTTADKVVTTNGSKVSRVVSQVGEDKEGITPLRLVAAVKATFNDGVAQLQAGEFGFHLVYNNGTEDKDCFYSVEKLKLSIASTVGGTTTFYASEHSTYEAKDGEEKKTMADFYAATGIEDAGYNAFIAVEVEVPTAKVDTLIAAEAYSSNGENYDLSSQTKKTNATGRASYFYEVGDKTGEMVYRDKETYEEYALKDVALSKNEVLKIYNSYGEEVIGENNAAENYAALWNEGRFVSPFSATYSFYFKPSQSQTYVGIKDIDSTKIFFLSPHYDFYNDGKKGNWVNDNPRFALNIFSSEHNEWVDFFKMDDNLYYAIAPDYNDLKTVIFCRMNPNNLENNWDNKWNQSANIAIDGKSNKYVPTNWDYTGTSSKIVTL